MSQRCRKMKYGERGRMSERELLLLSNYVYLDDSCSDRTIAETLDTYRSETGSFDAKSVAAVKAGGGMNAKQVAELFIEMDAMPEHFRALTPDRIVNHDGLRALAYPTGDHTATVVFRGTGGSYEAWNDNVIGEYLPDTKIQKQAAAFVNDCSASYSSLTLTGHSKGGNLAMYSTVMCAGVTSCVSFDGQGFSDAFLKQYETQIGAAAPKIKSISAHNDYVNLLLQPIAGEQVYAENEKGGLYAHSAFYLYQSNTFDENGNLVSTRAQSLPAAALGQALALITAGIDRLPADGNEKISKLIAAYTSSILSSDRSPIYEQGKLIGAQLGVGAYLLSMLPRRLLPHDEILRLAVHRNEQEGKGIRGASERLTEAAGEIGQIRHNCTVLMDSMPSDSKVNSYVNLSLEEIMTELKREREKLTVYSDLLSEIDRTYSNKERYICDRIYA